jgi:hypothetical protein
MGNFVQVLFLTLAGVLLLWFGFNLFYALPAGGRAALFGNWHRPRRKKPSGESSAGAPRTCPVCCAKLLQGERVKSSAFPSMGGADRFMHIFGCVYCMEADRRRVCPVCKTTLREEEYLVARLFEKPGRSHVHVIGCTRCKLRKK